MIEDNICKDCGKKPFCSIYQRLYPNDLRRCIYYEKEPKEEGFRSFLGLDEVK